MNPDDFTTNELDLVCDLNFNISDPYEVREVIELLSIPTLKYLVRSCETTISQQEALKLAARRRLAELED
jgi:hypothetical protein